METPRGLEQSMTLSSRGSHATAKGLVRHLHGLVTTGPGDLEISHTLSAFGYDAVKWEEGRAMLAELVTCEAPGERSLVDAHAWYREAATTARRALAAQPSLLAKLELCEVCSK